MSFEYINKAYGLNVSKGVRVIAYGKPGVVTSDQGHYVGIRLDGKKHSCPYHPTDGIVYLSADESQTKEQP